jgi:hypothetical protein
MEWELGEKIEILENTPSLIVSTINPTWTHLGCCAEAGDQLPELYVDKFHEKVSIYFRLSTLNFIVIYFNPYTWYFQCAIW